MNITIFIVYIIASLFGTISPARGQAGASLTYKGHDISSLLTLESSGYSYSLNNKVTPLEEILHQGGMNYVRSRVWVNPQGGVYNLAYNLKLGERMKRAGLGLYIDLHYSDTWADPGHQSPPAGWPVNNIDALVNTVNNYTRGVVSGFKQAGIDVDIISIGNEITNGLLWPTGKTPHYGNISRLLHAASTGAKDGNQGHPPKIMVHIDDGWDWGRQSSFYDNVLKAGPFTANDFDIQGLSFYPFYGTGATLANLNSATSQMAKKYNKDIVIAETDWPYSCPNGPALSEPSIPVGAQGQVEWVKRIAEVVQGIPNGHGKGIFYWEPAWANNAALGSKCHDNVLFDSSTSKTFPARTSVNMFQNI